MWDGTIYSQALLHQPDTNYSVASSVHVPREDIENSLHSQCGYMDKLYRGETMASELDLGVKKH